MNTVIVASTRPYTGKSGIVLALAGLLADRGRRAAYFKPYGTMPATVEGAHTDLDAAYIARTIGSSAQLEDVCPVVESAAFIEDVVAGRLPDVTERVLGAFGRVAEGADVVLVEGPSDLYQGRSVGISLDQVASLLSARVVLVVPGERTHLPDDVLCAAELMGDRLAGVVFNAVHASVREFIEHRSIPFLTRRGIEVFGAVPHDGSLASVTVAVGGLIYIAVRGTIAGPLMDLGFALYGALMLGCAVQALRLARASEFERHSAWALRLFVLVMGSLIFRLQYVIWYSLTDGLWSNEQLTGPFDQVQYFAFYLPYLAALELWLRRRSNEGLRTSVR